MVIESGCVTMGSIESLVCLSGVYAAIKVVDGILRCTYPGEAHLDVELL